MCLLTFFPPGVMPDTAALLNGAYLNDDGHGFAIVAGDHLVVHRGMDADTMVETFDMARHHHPHGPALFHSRFGTHGQRTIDNCHPFPIGDDGRTVLAHNGILPSAVQPANGDPRSDTRIAAEDYLATFGSLRLRRTRLRIERWMTPHNKVVILTADPRFRQRAYILNEEAGIWDAEIWYSNDGYLPLAPSRCASWSDPLRDWPGSPPPDRVLDRCWLCQAVIDVTDSQCRYCGWCQDCGETPDDCLCHTPVALDDRFGHAGTA